MRQRSWRWLSARIRGLLDRPPTYVVYESGDHQKITAVPATRIGCILNPPKFD